MRFGIDFDGTFSRDPALFRRFVADLRAAGHDAVLVTGRSNDGITPGGTSRWGDEVRAAVGDMMPIVFAGLRWKRDAAKEEGYPVDVWIDDNPEDIGPQNASITAHNGAGASVPACAGFVRRTSDPIVCRACRGGRWDHKGERQGDA